MDVAATAVAVIGVVTVAAALADKTEAGRAEAATADVVWAGRVEAKEVKRAEARGAGAKGTKVAEAMATTQAEPTDVVATGAWGAACSCYIPHKARTGTETSRPHPPK